MENASGRSHMRVCECKRKPETHTVMTVCPKKKKYGLDAPRRLREEFHTTTTRHSAPRAR